MKTLKKPKRKKAHIRVDSELRSQMHLLIKDCRQFNRQEISIVCRKDAIDSIGYLFGHEGYQTTVEEVKGWYVIYAESGDITYRQMTRASCLYSLIREASINRWDVDVSYNGKEVSLDNLYSLINN